MESTKRRKSSIKIPRNIKSAEKIPASAEATWSQVHIRPKDVSKLLTDSMILNGLKIYRNITGDDKKIAASRLTLIVNRFIYEWMLQEQSSATDHIIWAQNIHDAATALLACMGLVPSDNWAGEIPLETKYNLIAESEYDWDSNPRLMQKLAGLPADSFQAIEQAGKAVFVIKEMAQAAVKGYKKQKLPLASRHKKDKALVHLFVGINAIYQLTTGKEATASNSGKSHSVRFGTAFLKTAALRIKETYADQGAICPFMIRIRADLEKLAGNAAKIARLIREARNMSKNLLIT